MFENRNLEMLAYEAILRRAVQLEHPFMLKGSYVTRQYFADPALRIPNDLDWVYLERLEYEDDVPKTFNGWMTQLTELYENDGVRFRSFRENAFWRMIDYAMADDFPTVNTDLCCWVEGEEVNPLQLDISFNLPVHLAPQPLLYNPLRGAPFTIPNTVPLALQVSWKLHQSLVRARFKDLFDLMHLVVHPSFTAETSEQSIEELVKECALDNTDPRRLHYLLNGDWGEIFHLLDIKFPWDYWRHEIRNEFSGWVPAYFDDTASKITDAERLPERLTEFKDQFQQAFQTAGFYSIDIASLNKRSHEVSIDDFFRQEVPPRAKAVEKKQGNWIQFFRKLFNPGK